MATKFSIYKNLYSKSMTIKSTKYEINARKLTSCTIGEYYELAVYSLPNYELMTDYVPQYSTSAEIKKDLKMWLNILNFQRGMCA